MSGDVQPRKRKDKKKKKDELGVDDPRGTAAVLGEGDVFIHSQHDHGTGGHWCAKIIFFSLLAVLITLIGLIILENRGLTELEANSVESRYSGVLEGWLEDSSDDHHDEHTLELKHHDIQGDDDHLDVESDEDEFDQENEESQEDNETQEEDDEDNDSNAVESNEDEDTEDDNYKNESEEDLEEDDSNEEDDETVSYARYNLHKDDDNDEDDINEDDGKNYDESDTDEDQREENNDDDEDQSEEHNDDDENESEENNDDDDDQSEENNDDYEDQSEKNNDDDEDQSEENNDDDVEQSEENKDQNYENSDDERSDEDNNIEEKYDNLSNEITDDKDGVNEADINNEQKNINFQKYYDERENENEFEQQDDQSLEDDDDDEIEKIEKEINRELVSEETVGKYSEAETSKEDISGEVEKVKKTEFQSFEEDDVPLERITMPPAGRPFVEIEEETPEKPINTLADEEEYEKRQAQLRKEEEAQGTQIWLKLAVGGALLVATHAVLRRATAPRDVPETEEHTREETPVVDRRMTLVAEQSSERAQQESPVTNIARQVEDDSSKPTPFVVTSPLVKQKEEVKTKKTVVDEKVPAAVSNRDDEDEEKYSEEEDLEDEEEDVQEPIKEIVQQKLLQSAQQKPTEESEPEDVEIIDDEEIEEEQEEDDEDEEEISDVDDTELLTRLEAKYGRLPEPERPGQKHKDGGNSVDDDWPGEPSDRYWRAELDRAEEDLRQGAWSACEKRVNVAALANSGRARWLAARALDMSAEAKRDNGLLSKAIAAYIHLLKLNERLSDKKVLEVAQRTIDRIQFRGTYLNAEPIYRLLIRRFPDNVNYRNNLTVSFLMANRADLADEVLKETLLLWPKDRVALAHRGFVLKNQYNKLEEAVQALYMALEGDTGPANEPRFYYHLGDALLLLGRFEEAHEVHKRGAVLGHFLSPSQRSLYNVPRLKSRPWWSADETPYAKLIQALERSWRDILKEGEAAKALYEKEKEGLKERGEWSQLDIFARGSEIPGRCNRAPVTCSIIRSEPAAAGCRRGQVKFSAMSAGTHVRPHVGPTNCRLRMHLGLSNTKETYIRVDKETRQWQVGKTFIFDDSFEHEVWHNGTGTRLVLIVDVWHPELTAAERRTLPAI